MTASDGGAVWNKTPWSVLSDEQWPQNSVLDPYHDGCAEGVEQNRKSAAQGRSPEGNGAGASASTRHYAAAKRGMTVQTLPAAFPAPQVRSSLIPSQRQFLASQELRSALMAFSWTAGIGRGNYAACSSLPPAWKPGKL